MITKGKQQLKIPEPGSKGASLDLLNLSVKGNLVSARSLGGRYGKADPSGPAVQSGSGSARLRGSNFRGDAAEALEREHLRTIQAAEKETRDDSNSASGVNLLRAGAVEMDDKCLSCAGSPAHSMELFKAACISYKPSLVSYRNSKLSRAKLMEMKQTLLAKCEEFIGSEAWLHSSDGLSTEVIFSDLLQYHASGQSPLPT